MIDLHIHSNYSDGTCEVKEILSKAEEKKIKVISITDHEACLAHFELQSIDLQRYYSGKVITGIELKNYYKDRVIDILGYNFNLEKMNEYLHINYENKTHRILEEKNLKHLYKQAKGYDLKIAPIQEIEWDPDKDWGSVVFYNEIKKHPENEEKLPSDLWESFSNFKKDYVYNRQNMFFIDKKDDYPSPSKTIDAIHAAGGRAFLAHVHEYKWVKNKIEYIEELLNTTKLDGIECYYSNFTNEQTKELIEFCNRKKILMSGGTDYHGNNKKNIDIGTGKGNLNIPEDILKKW